MKIRKILIPTDLSETSRVAFRHAAALADVFDASLMAVHVEEDRLPPLVVEYATVGLEEIQAAQLARARERLAEETAHCLPGRDVEQIVRTGVPHIEIVELAREQGVDLIVTATHGRGFISHAILGSTAERVVHRASCPVYVAREAEVSDG